MAVPSPTRRAKLSADGSGVYDILQRSWQRSYYAGDYLGLVLLMAAYILLQILGEPFHRMFRLDDPRIQFPHAEVERVSVSHLFVYAGAIPLALLVLSTITLRPSIHKAHVTILGLIITILLTSFITDIIKDAVGRPRPDLMARCKPDISAPLHELVTIDVCTETDHHTLHDGWRSFPSGHSSFAFAGLGYMACFLASQAQALRPRASLAVMLLCFAPLLGAALIAASRLEDYRHDFADVITGSWIGFVVAYVNWRRYYPSLLEQGCEEPHAASAGSGRGRGSPSGGFQRVRDEEEGYSGAGERFSIEDDGVAEGYRRDGVTR
ncbi:hypothetical protein B0A55_03028 [Friedmanniomyces simplex]|uniref:Phosphatidic acid phosphatase type 2/haloperoxidase domain-containing protein n=1 Tax=Friedmanniomyces simplex TaxID=329884 RepID=A0A4U0XWM7_9PEZI|nr:hypothetical protein B0A55_03028 [Friedmanniomyces simplex]